MIPELPLVTAAHAWIRDVAIGWVIVSLISLWIWAWCKERIEDDEDAPVIPAAPGRASDRRKVS